MSLSPSIPPLPLLLSNFDFQINVSFFKKKLIEKGNQEYQKQSYI